MDDTSWFKKAIIYHILIDRFAGFKSTKNWEKPQFLGGNIKGIINKISYLKNLGVNTIWVSPFYKTSEYHGYHITDFYEVDPHFGSTQDVKDLIETIHENDMRIITDFVPNHCSSKHPYFIDAQKNKDSKYKDWFYFTKWPDNYLCFLSIKELSKINLNHPEARDHIINAAKYWINLGFDGFRLDHVIGPSHVFWKQFKTEIKKEKKDVVLIGEAWMKGIKFHELKTIKVKHKILKWFFGASSEMLFKEYMGILDGVLDFRLQELLRDYVARADKQSELKKEIRKHYSKYPANYFLPTFLDNHDMDRFLFECHDNKDKLKQAAEIQFSIDQPAIIYYGAESGMTQKKSIWEFSAYGDLQARQPMNWDEQDIELLNFYREIIRQKKK